MAARERKVERVVYTSSTSVYGNPRSIPINEDDGARAALAVRGEQARRRALLPRVLRELRPADRGASATRTSSAPASGPDNPYCGVVGKFLARHSRRASAVGPRRRRADARLHVHRRRGRRDAAGRDPSARRGRGLQRRDGHRDLGQPARPELGGALDRPRSTSSTSTGATSTTSGAGSSTSRRPGGCCAGRRR